MIIYMIYIYDLGKLLFDCCLIRGLRRFTDQSSPTLESGGNDSYIQLTVKEKQLKTVSIHLATAMYTNTVHRTTDDRCDN